MNKSVGLHADVEEQKRELLRGFNELTPRDANEVFAACLSFLHTRVVLEREDAAEEALALLDEGYSVKDVGWFVGARAKELTGGAS